MIEVENLKKYFPITGFFGSVKGYVKAVDGVSFNIKRGEVFGIVGESGCGKTTLARTVIKLIEPTSGKVYFEGQNIFELNKKEFQKLRRQMQIVYQNPYGSLNPRMKVKDIIGDSLKAHNVVSGKELKQTVGELLLTVGLEPAHMDKYPHEFSGGQRQRIAIARALAMTPKFLLLDEPTSSLDVSVEAKILNMLKHLRADRNLTYLYITHNLGVIRIISDRIAVMYLGRIVETTNSRELFDNPLHPYTKALMAAIPKLTHEKQKLSLLEGEVPSPIDVPRGCSFHPRCPLKEIKVCDVEVPELRSVQKDHWVACHRL